MLPRGFSPPGKKWESGEGGGREKGVKIQGVAKISCIPKDGNWRGVERL